MVGGSRALRGILSCAVALTVTACSDDSSGADAPAAPSSTTTTVPAGPELETNTDDVVAAMRSLLEFDFWTEREPAAAESRSDEWLVPGGPYAQDVAGAIAEQLEEGTAARGHPEILDIRVERQDQTTATVLVWMRSDGYLFEGPLEHQFESPPFERTLFVYELQRETGGAWRISERRITQTL